MPAVKHLCLGVVACGALLVAALYVGLTAFSACMDGVGPPVRCSLEEEQQRAELLEADHVLLNRSMRATERIREDLVAGRLTLRQAAAALVALNAARPARLRIRTEYFPGDTEEERFARSTVERVGRSLAADPGGAAVMARLEGELKEYLAEKEGRRPRPPAPDFGLLTPDVAAEGGQP
jgi:hypothetical protein